MDGGGIDVYFLTGMVAMERIPTLVTNVVIADGQLQWRS